MTDYPGWNRDPTGRHPERYFDSNGALTQLVRNGQHEFTDSGFLQSTPPPPPFPYQPQLGASYDPPTQQVPAVTSSAPPPARRNRNWWLVGAGCILVVALVAALVAAFQQHKDADTWHNSYRSEVTIYKSEVAGYKSELRKSEFLYFALLSTQKQLSTATNEKNTAVSANAVLTTALGDAGVVAQELNTCVNDIENLISKAAAAADGHIAPSFDSDANTAGAVCRQAQSENTTMQETLRGR
jgi:hypothetical protein